MTLKRLQTGLYGPTYYGGFSPFLNWWKTAKYPTITRSAGGALEGKAIWDAGGYLDTATGEIVANSGVTTITRNFFSATPAAAQVTAGCDFAGETWVAEWDGTATASFGLLGVGSSQSAVGSNKRIMTMGTTAGDTTFILTVTDQNDPPRNVRIYQSRYAANVAAGEKFNPDWLAEISKFGVIRFMDWQQTNNNDITDFSQLADEPYLSWCSGFGTGDQSSASENGPKGSIHPALICQLANLTGCKVHVNFPVKCADAFATSFATYMRDNTSAEVLYEYSNELFHSGFNQASYCQTQGNIKFAGDGGTTTDHGRKWYGYRASQLLAIVRGVYNDASRWHGVISGQAVSSAPLVKMLEGFTAWKTEVSSPLNVNDIFKSFQVAPYFGNMNSWLTGQGITGITKANPAVVTSASHGYSNGQKLKIRIRVGMVELSDTYATVANKTTDTYELSGVNSTGYTTFASDTGNYSVKAAFFELMDKSNTNFVNSPGTYPTKYTYFNQQMKKLCLTGVCDEPLTADTHINDYKNVQWPALKTLAASNQVEMRQYEGGYHLVGDVYVSGFGGIPQFTEYLLASGHSQEIADVYAENYRAAIAFGFRYPSKFVEAGQVSKDGAWAGIRFWPLVANGNTNDLSNPVWTAVSAVRDGAVSDAYSVAWA